MSGCSLRLICKTSSKFPSLQTILWKVFPTANGTSFSRTIATTIEFRKKHRSPFDEEPPSKSCGTEEDTNLHLLYRSERESPRHRGIELLKDPRTCKGLAFTLYERQYFGIHGLLPPAVMTEDQQVYRTILRIRQQPNDLSRYVLLDSLQDRDEKLYYRVIADHVKELIPIVYTPTVGLACQKFGYIYRKPKGLYVTIHDNSISKIYHILSNWPERDVRVIVVTDGERILGLGDLGCCGMGIPVGKLALYVALAGVQPKWCLPVLLDVGTNNEDLLKDPLYIGLRRKRLRGEEYNSFVDNFMKACIKRFGQSLLIQFEDFGRQNANYLLETYRNQYCTFNDDIQGTGAIVVAGLLSCQRYTKRPLSAEKIVFLGAGGAAMGIADLIVSQMLKEGLSRKEACSRIYLMDVDGLVTKKRQPMEPTHVPYAKNMPETQDFLELIKEVEPTAIMGLSTCGGAFTEEVIRTMAQLNPTPIIFALSNPTSKAECTAKQAVEWTDGKVLFASGSPFDNVHYKGEVYKPGQGNNSYIFPGVGLAAILFKIRHIDDEMFLIAARAVANCVNSRDIERRCLYPSLNRIREVSLKIVLAIGEYAYKRNMAALYPKPVDMEKYVRCQMYVAEYDEILDYTYEWPCEMVQSYPIPRDNTNEDD